MRKTKRKKNHLAKSKRKGRGIGASKISIRRTRTSATAETSAARALAAAERAIAEAEVAAASLTALTEQALSVRIPHKVTHVAEARAATARDTAEKAVAEWKKAVARETTDKAPAEEVATDPFPMRRPRSQAKAVARVVEVVTAEAVVATALAVAERAIAASEAAAERADAASMRVAEAKVPLLRAAERASSNQVLLTKEDLEAMDYNTLVKMDNMYSFTTSRKTAKTRKTKDAIINRLLKNRVIKDKFAPEQAAETRATAGDIWEAEKAHAKAWEERQVARETAEKAVAEWKKAIRDAEETKRVVNRI